MTISTNPAQELRADKLRLLDEHIVELQAQLKHLSVEAMELYVSLLVDEMLEKARELDFADSLNDIVNYYFGDMKLVLLFDKTTYFGQLLGRVPNGRNSLEPFASCFNAELKRRGASVRIATTFGGWYGTHVVSV